MSWSEPTSTLKFSLSQCQFYQPSVVSAERATNETGNFYLLAKTHQCDELRSFLAFFSYCRRLFKGFVKVACPLNVLLKKEGDPDQNPD